MRLVLGPRLPLSRYVFRAHKPILLLHTHTQAFSTVAGLEGMYFLNNGAVCTGKIL